MVIPVVTKKVLFDDATRFLKLDANFEGVKLKAEQGNAQAQYNLGFLYEYGFGLPEGVVKDQKEAVKWHRLAAEQGNKHAQYHLGSKIWFMPICGTTLQRQMGVKWQKR